jgi:hypothetical protein
MQGIGSLAQKRRAFGVERRDLLQEPSAAFCVGAHAFGAERGKAL